MTDEVKRKCPERYLGTLKTVFADHTGYSFLSVQPNGPLALVSGNVSHVETDPACELWNSESKTMVYQSVREYDCFFVGPEGKVWSEFDPSLKLHNLRDSRTFLPVHSVPLDTRFTRVSACPSKPLLAIARTGVLDSREYITIVTVHGDSMTYSPLHVQPHLQLRFDVTNPVVFRPDGEIIGALFGATCSLFDARTFSTVQTWKAEKSCKEFHISDDGIHVFVQHDGNKRVSIWDLRMQTDLQKNDDDFAHTLAVGAMGETFVTGTISGGVNVWDTNTSTRVESLGRVFQDSGLSEWVLHMEFNQMCDRLAVQYVNGEVDMWDMTGLCSMRPPVLAATP